MDDPNSTVRYLVARGLIEAGTNISVELLAQALQHSSSRIRQTVVEVLVGTEEPIPINLLFIALQDEDWWVRYKAATALKKFLTRSAQKIPQIFLQSEKSDIVITEILEAIGGINQKELVPLETVLLLFDNESKRVRALAIRVLGQFGTCAPVDLLLAMLGDTEQEVRDAAAE